MMTMKCDVCGEELKEHSAYHPYSESKGKKMDMCLFCYNAYSKYRKKADAEFFKKKGGKK